MGLLEDTIKEWVVKHTLTPRFQAALVDRAKARGSSDAEQLWTSLMTDVNKSLKDAIASGASPKDVKAALADVLGAYGVGGLSMPDGKTADTSTWYADLVYRQTWANATAEGRDKALFDEEYTERAPFWQFHCVKDSRNDSDDECPDQICRRLDKLVFAKSDIGAQIYLAPLHWQCRCDISELTGAEVKRRGLSVVAGSSIGLTPMAGFGGRRF